MIVYACWTVLGRVGEAGDLDPTHKNLFFHHYTAWKNGWASNPQPHGNLYPAQKMTKFTKIRKFQSCLIPYIRNFSHYLSNILGQSKLLVFLKMMVSYLDQVLVWKSFLKSDSKTESEVVQEESRKATQKAINYFIPVSQDSLIVNQYFTITLPVRYLLSGLLCKFSAVSVITDGSERVLVDWWPAEVRAEAPLQRTLGQRREDYWSNLIRIALCAGILLFLAVLLNQ